MKKRWICLILALILITSSVGPVAVSAENADASDGSNTQQEGQTPEQPEEPAEMTVSQEFIELLKLMEGFHHKAYWDYSQWTIGYGTKCPSDKVNYYTDENPLSKEEAERMLYDELVYFENVVRNFAKKYNLKLKQHQYDALVSFSYNCGGGWTTDTNGYFNRAVREGDMGSAFIYGMCLWSTAGDQYKLIARRLCEANMYINGIYKNYTNPNNVPTDFKYVFLDGNGGTPRYEIHAYDMNDVVAVMENFSQIPTGSTEEGVAFAYTFGGWYTDPMDDATRVETLDGSLENGTVLYARWLDPEGQIAQLPVSDPIEAAEVTVNSVVDLYIGAGTHYKTIGKTEKGQTLTIIGTRTVKGYLWGQYDGGWIKLNATNFDEVMAERDKVDSWPRWGTVNGTGVNYRVGPGTTYEKVGQKNTGDRVHIQEMVFDGDLYWGRMEDDNWICLSYVVLDDLEEPELPPEEEKTIVSLEILAAPYKQEYVQMQDLLRVEGSVIFAVYSDGSSFARTMNLGNTTGFSNETLGENKVTVYYEGLSASFTVNIIKATVIFLHEDGTILSQDTYEYGQTVTLPEEPVKPADEEGEFVFVGWSPEVTTCNGDAVYTAVFERYVERFPVVFVHEDGTVLDFGEYAIGEEVIVPEAPVKEGDDVYGYRFVGWDSEVVPCDGMKVYTAVFEQYLKQYLVTFLHEDGTVLHSYEYAFGEEVKAPEAPQKAGDETYGYLFAGWDSEVVPCDGEKVYTAVFEQYLKQYLVTFLHEDGTVLHSYEYAFGEEVTAPTAPEKEGDKTYGYRFVGWDSEVVPCDGEKVYTAVFEQYLKKYLVVFRDHDGTELSSGEYAIGETVTPPPAPEREEDETGSYVFVGWDSEVTSCEGEKVYTAVYAWYPPVILGDFDGNEIVNEDDAIYLLRFVFFPELYPVESPADFNQDGVINEDDAIYLLRHVFFPEMYPLTEAK